MDAKTLRALGTVEELDKKINELKEEHFRARFQHSMNQLENNQALNKLRKDIARAKTIRCEFLN